MVLRNSMQIINSATLMEQIRSIILPIHLLVVVLLAIISTRKCHSTHLTERGIEWAQNFLFQTTTITPLRPCHLKHPPKQCNTKWMLNLLQRKNMVELAPKVNSLRHIRSMVMVSNIIMAWIISRNKTRSDLWGKRLG